MTEHDGLLLPVRLLDFCCRATRSSTYNIVAGRSKDVLGPFLGPRRLRR